MSTKQDKVLGTFKMRNILIPVVIGFAIAAIFIFKDLRTHGIGNFRFSSYYLIWFVCAILMICLRHLTYMYRIWLLSDRKISFKNTFSTIMLWEFASSVTPTIVGGTAVAFFIIYQEGIKMGRTTAIVVITAFLDELFFIIMIPLFIVFLNHHSLFIAGTVELGRVALGTREVFFAGYGIIFLLTLLMFIGVFVSPRLVKRILCGFTQLRFLRKWKHNAEETGNDVITASNEFRNRSFLFWLKAFIATAISWSARYLTVNFLILVFVASNDQVLIFARQMLMWVILLVSPTPGASGVAEYGFTVFLGEFMPAGLSATLAFLWRLISYYPYIFAGIFILPIWTKRVMKRKKLKQLPEKD